MLEIETDKLIENALRDGIREGIKDKMKSSYNNPIDNLIVDAIAKHGGSFRDLLSESLQACMEDRTFRNDIIVSVRHGLAKTLVAKFGGELEKQVNALKSDPATRARITLAIEEIVKQKAS